MMENFIMKHHSTAALVKKNISSDVPSNFNENINKQTKITPIDNTRISKLNNNRQESDADHEVQLTNEKVII